MPISIETEELLSLTEATKVLPRVNGRRPSVPTLWRWCRKGLQGVQLEYVRVGRNIATTREALGRFYHALAAADSIPEKTKGDNQVEPLTPTPRARARMLTEADRVLERAGI